MGNMTVSPNAQGVLTDAVTDNARECSWVDPEDQEDPALPNTAQPAIQNAEARKCLWNAP